MGAYSSRVETWALYATGSTVILTRILARWRMVGFSGYQADDWLIFLSWATYTVMTYAADVVGGLGDLHALPLETRRTLTPEEAEPYIYGTKWFCVGVATYNLFIWSLKFNMLFLYQRVVRGLYVERFIKPTMILLAATFFVTVTALFAACRPYNRMWTVYPDQGPYCKPQSTLNIVLPLAFNLLTDIIVTAIPAPVIWKVQATFWKRIGLLFLFGAIAFIMTAAILRVTMVLLYQSGPVAAIWSCREDVVAILVGQFFLLRPMLRKSFWTRRGTRTGNLPSRDSRDAGNPGPSFGRSFKGKPNDPFSVTVALATVNASELHSGGNPHIRESSDNISGSSLEEHKHHGEYLYPARAHEPRANLAYVDDMVIHVTKHISVEKSEANQKALEEVSQWPLHPTNRAKAWNGSNGSQV